MDASVNFDPHVNQQVAKVNRMLRFVKRNAKPFDDLFVTKSLLCASVRPILEYSCVGWNSFTITHKNRIEFTRLLYGWRRIVRFAIRGQGWANPVGLPPYE